MSQMVCTGKLTLSG